MSAYTVHPLQMAKAERPTAGYTYLRNSEETSSVFYGPFLLKSADRYVLVDTGCDAVNYAAGPLPPVEDVTSLEQNLSRFGLAIEKIDAVVPGHSTGSRAVIVETEEGRTAVSGFCCLATNFAKGNLAVRGIHENFEESYNSMLKLMRLTEIIYANHSVEAVRL